MSRVSIIVPIYKVEEYIDKCVNSIINQSYQDIQILLVDDGSPDHCPEICDQYAKEDDRISVVHKENGGLVSARKAGLEQATGTYVMYVDGDDWLEADYVERVMEKALTNDADIVVTGYAQGDEQTLQPMGNVLSSGLYAEDAKRKLEQSLLYTGNFYEAGLIPAAWNKLYKREVLFDWQMAVPNEIKMGEDAAFTYLALLASRRVYVDNENCGYCYRYVVNSMSRSYDSNYFDRLNILYEYLDNRIRKSNEAVWTQLQYYWCFMILLGMEQELPQWRNKGLPGVIQSLKTHMGEAVALKHLELDALKNMPGITQKLMRAIQNKSVYKFLILEVGKRIFK
ncbi:MAG: glycosyltransferase family 2 protein [Lachnospiraceae bacterium]|nr:glycosyltransferase family 2 protein [Lachnospiraceae bacterium]